MSAKSTIFLKQEGNFSRINLENILYLEASDNYVKLCGDGNQQVLRITLSGALTQFPNGLFLRISRSIAVRIEEVMQFSKDHVVFSNDMKVEFRYSKKYYEEFLEQITFFILNTKNDNS